jgi:hypothetical protein
MRRTAGWLLAGTVAISGCTVISGPAGRLPNDQGFDPVVVRTPRPTLPNVFVTTGHLVVDQEPIRLWLRDYGNDKVNGTAKIAWELDANSDSQWPKPEEAIVFSPPLERHPCEVRGVRRKVLLCTLPYKEKASYKYTLKAMDGKSTIVLDPNIVNME